MRAGRLPRERVRLVAGIVVIIAFIALAVLAIAASHSSFSVSEPAGASEPVRAVPSVPNLVDISTPLPARVNPLPVPAVAVDTPTTGPSAPTDTATPPVAAVPAGKPCAQLNLPAPEKVGGIQSLIRLVPLFGPFAPEAFAMVPALQPGIDALGPLFPLFQQGLDAAAPVLDLITPPAAQLGQAGFGALAPLYGPYRQNVLDSETQLASFLEPIVATLAQAPGSECLVALEGLLASLPPSAG